MIAAKSAPGGVPARVLRRRRPAAPMRLMRRGGRQAAPSRTRGWSARPARGDRRQGVSPSLSLPVAFGARIRPIAPAVRALPRAGGPAAPSRLRPDTRPGPSTRVGPPHPGEAANASAASWARIPSPACGRRWRAAPDEGAFRACGAPPSAFGTFPRRRGKGKSIGSYGCRLGPAKPAQRKRPPGGGLFERFRDRPALSAGGP